jgi:hypothetical protein
MDARPDVRSVVKPPLYFSENDFGHVQALRNLRHVRVARDTWRAYLSRWRPRLVVSEIASTPLFETLPLDVDIFLMVDPVFPFSESAAVMLRKRVHIFETADELAEAIRRYGRVSLPRLRDDTFYDTYVNRGSTAAVAQLLGSRAFTPNCDASAA